MTMDEFVSMTCRVLLTDGLDGFCPTLLLPARRHAVVLDAVLAEEDASAAVRAWAEGQTTETEDYFLACRADAWTFLAVARVDGIVTERRVAAPAPEGHSEE